MRRIYLGVVIILIAIAFLGGYYIGSKDKVAVADLAAVVEERDSLTVELAASLSRSDSLDHIAASHLKKAVAADSTVLATKKAMEKQSATFKAYIAKAATYKEPQLDSFFVATYPDTLYRPSFNVGLRQMPIAVWRAQMLAQDRIRLDSVRAVAFGQATIIGEMEVGISERDSVIDAQASNLAEKDTTISIIVQREKTWIIEADHWQGEARKYKRQRNLLIVGGSTAGAVITYFVIRSLVN